MTDGLQLSPYLEAIGRDLDAAAARAVARRRRRRPLRIAALAAAALALICGTAVASSVLPVPGPIQAALDAYFPDDGSPLSPLPGHSQEVARFGDDVLYRAPAKDGTSTCTQITAIAADGKREIPDAGCAVDTGDPYWPIGVLSVAFHERELVAGQVKAPAGASLVVVRAGSEDAQVQLGADGFFLWEMPRHTVAADTDPRDLSRVIGSLVLRDADGTTLSSMRLSELLRAGRNGP